jgi:Tol biopolymer transport system component
VKRTSQKAKVLATLVLTTLTTMALAPGVGATFPDRNGLIAFQADIGDNGPQIFTIRSNGHELTQITHVDGIAAVPDWSPDGRQIAFTLNECAIALMDADGGNLHEIASEPIRICAWAMRASPRMGHDSSTPASTLHSRPDRSGA